MATVARNGYPTVAKDVMTGNGVTLKDLERAKVEAFDMRPIREAMK